MFCLLEPFSTAHEATADVFLCMMFFVPDKRTLLDLVAWTAHMLSNSTVAAHYHSRLQRVVQ